MTTEAGVTPGEKIEFLRSCGLYEILFRNAGVGCLFWTGPYDADGFPLPNWRDHLSIQHYYPTFIEAIDAEYERFQAVV